MWNEAIRNKIIIIYIWKYEIININMNEIMKIMWKI